ncbi:energy transducer TonB [Flavobacterium sangjuense]|uniref:TonB C-terminal domain-containing protein n=1 Tax=Flavobacterium sangjuense TaxID=2518177 RepID=A0A4P7PUM9_9FLAO|nr:energy transducer TonB [Flavobacterium sangjuense]QBZ97593.1 hypothetical protein GS03_01085 [Flavobacterium sangjuense]
MKLIKLFLFVLLPISGFSQIGGEDEVYLNGDRIEAKFRGGGIDNFTAFINRNFDYSKVTKAGKLEGAFTIDEQGNVTKIRITQVLDLESATEFIRVLKMCPKWEPAKRGGKPISIEIKYPMVFNVKPKPSENDSEVKEINENSNRNEGKRPGGLSKFYEYINKNYKLPDAPGLKGQVIVSFVINEDGSIGDYKVVKDLGYGTAEELIRVLKTTGNKWTPAKKNGKPVKTPFTLPLTIDIPE